VIRRLFAYQDRSPHLEPLSLESEPLGELRAEGERRTQTGQQILILESDHRLRDRLAGLHMDDLDPKREEGRSISVDLVLRVGHIIFRPRGRLLSESARWSPRLPLRSAVPGGRNGSILGIARCEETDCDGRRDGQQDQNEEASVHGHRQAIRRGACGGE